MKQWYQRNHLHFKKERDALAESCPLMMLSVVGPGFHVSPVSTIKAECAVAHGTYVLNRSNSHDEIGYGIVLVLPANYPNSPPIMFCNDPKLPIDTLKRRWRKGSNLVDFLSNLVDPFLAWQLYYDAFGKPPEWGERPHGIQGIINYYGELIGRRADDTIIGFMKLLSRKNLPKGHEYCPCGSGKRIRHCHQKLIINLREKISWLDVAEDLAAIQHLNLKDK
jgi:hypothetical protein